jgi:D-lactate dehydrogenase (cytochrome)
MLSLVADNSKSVFSTDIAVPISRLADIIGKRTLITLSLLSITEISKQELDDLGLFASILGHIGDGNFHESILYDKKDPKQVAAIEKCVKDMVDRALEMEGTCSGEHGVGMVKRKYLEQELGVDTINVMKSIKAALDPFWLMNPGKIIEIPE